MAAIRVIDRVQDMSDVLFSSITDGIFLRYDEGTGKFVGEELTSSRISDFAAAVNAVVSVPVQSVAGRTGAVTIVSADITDATPSNTPLKVIVRGAAGEIAAGAANFAGNIIGNQLSITRNLDGAIDSKVKLYNLSNSANSGSAVQFFHTPDGVTNYSSGRVGFRRWAASPAFGEFAVFIDAYGNESANPLLTLDINGTCTVTTLQTVSKMVAGTANATGICYGGNGSLRHGLWSEDHLDLHVRASTADVAVFTWNRRFGLGFTTRTGVNAKFHVLGNDAALPVAIFQGAPLQDGNLTEWQNPTGTAVLKVSSAGTLLPKGFIDGQIGTDDLPFYRMRAHLLSAGYALTVGNQYLLSNGTAMVVSTDGATANGRFDAAEYRVAGVKILGAQSPAIADADGTLADATRAINALLAITRAGSAYSALHA